ncbi:MAG: hypothetical protein JXA90_04270, partial [Planctomycetes bacterium]|nr:hypothetical protein [Planctomycetota bacterium]
MAERKEITLEEYLRSRGALPSDQVLKLACQILPKISRELSPGGGRPPVLCPARILLGPAGTVSVLASPAVEPPAERTARHPAYVSPEEIKGEGGDHRSQFYSLGCTLFELLTGRPPFAGRNPSETLRFHVREAIPEPSDYALAIDPRFSKILKELLYKDPD